MQQNNVKPRYEVEHVDEEVAEKHVRRIEGRNEEHTVMVPYGYNVYFPAGHSIRVRDDAELARLGFDKPAELVDEETGDIVGINQPMSLKKGVERRKGASNKRRSDTSSVEANQGD